MRQFRCPRGSESHTASLRLCTSNMGMGELLLTLDLSFIPSLTEMIRWCTKRNFKDQFNQVVQSLIYNTIWELWKTRNLVIFEGRKLPAERCFRKVKMAVMNLAFLFKGTLNNSIYSAMFIRSLKVNPRYAGSQIFSELTWVCPPPGWHKYNVDGATKGMPGEATSAGVFRNYRGFH